MMDQPSFEREINAYLVKVDGILEGCGLLHEKGSAKLNSVQKEVDMTLDKLRAMQRERRLDRVAIGQITNRSLNAVQVLCNQIKDGKSAPLGAIFGAASKDSMFTTPAWKAAFTNVTLKISNFTNTYGTLISNMDKASRVKIDKALASIVDNAQICFDKDPSDAGANRYLGTSLKALENLEAAAQREQSVSSASMLQLLVQEKDQERVRLLSEMKLIENHLTPQQISVVNDANRRVMEKLNAILGDSSSYNAAVRNKKIQLVNSDLDIMRKVTENHEFSQKLGIATRRPRSMGTRLGHLNKNKAAQPFRYALASNLGGGTGVAFQDIDLTAESTTPFDILSAVKQNTTVLKAQGTLDADQRPKYLRQVNSLTKAAFGGDETALNEAQRHYRLLVSNTMNGVFTYDEPRESMINGVRLLGSLGLYLGLPATALYIYGARSKAKSKKAMEAMLMGESE